MQKKYILIFFHNITFFGGGGGVQISSRYCSCQRRFITIDKIIIAVKAQV